PDGSARRASSPRGPGPAHRSRLLQRDVHPVRDRVPGALAGGVEGEPPDPCRTRDRRRADLAQLPLGHSVIHGGHAAGVVEAGPRSRAGGCDGAVLADPPRTDLALPQTGRETDLEDRAERLLRLLDHLPDEEVELAFAELTVFDARDETDDRVASD